MAPAKRFAFFLFFLAVGLARPARALQLLDGTAATVGKVLVTVQDAYFFRALERYRDGEPEVLTPEEGVALRRTVQKIVFEEMVYEEMKSFKVEEGSRSEAVALLHGPKTRGREGVLRQILQRYGRTESIAIDRLFKSLQVEHFVQKKVETLTPIITEGEAERYYQQNQARFQGSAYESLKPNIILLLKKQRMQKGLEEWVRSLKDKYAVTSLLDS